MNFTAMIRNVGEETPWKESFNEAGVTTQEQAEKWTRETVEWFNSTLRAGEVQREVVSVRIGEGEEPLDHHWTKINLVTLQDHRGMFDNVRCTRCGATARRYGLTSIRRSATFRAKKWQFCPSVPSVEPKVSRSDEGSGLSQRERGILD